MSDIAPAVLQVILVFGVNPVERLMELSRDLILAVFRSSHETFGMLWANLFK